MKDVSKALPLLKQKLSENDDVTEFVKLFDDKMLMQFIRGKKYDLDKAHQCVLNLISARSQKFVDFTLNLKPSNSPLLKSGKIRILKNRDEHGRIIVVDQVRLWDVSIYGVDDGISGWVLMADEVVRRYEEGCDKGVVCILDFGDYTYAQAKLLTPRAVIKGFHLVLNSMPLRLKGTHIINHGHLVNMLATAVRPFLSPKIRSRFHTHSKFETLHKVISPNILPERYGGMLTDEEAFDNEFVENIDSSEPFYENFIQRVKQSNGI